MMLEKINLQDYFYNYFVQLKMAARCYIHLCSRANIVIATFRTFVKRQTQTILNNYLLL